MGLTVADQMGRLQQTFSEYSKVVDSDGAGGHHGAAAAASHIDGLDTQISEGFDRLNQNVGAAFSAYSGVLKQAVAVLDKTEPGLEEHVLETAAHAGPKALAH
jgi:hydrogenase maturation factor